MAADRVWGDMNDRVPLAAGEAIVRAAHWPRMSYHVFGSERPSTWAAPIWIEAPAIAGMPPAGSCPFDPFYELLADAPGLAMALREHWLRGHRLIHLRCRQLIAAVEVDFKFGGFDGLAW